VVAQQVASVLGAQTAFDKHARIACIGWPRVWPATYTRGRFSRLDPCYWCKVKNTKDLVSPSFGFGSPDLAGSRVEPGWAVESYEFVLPVSSLQETRDGLLLHCRPFCIGNDVRARAYVDLLWSFGIQFRNEASGEDDAVLAWQVILDSATAELVMDFGPRIDFPAFKHSSFSIQDVD
jgi:hypothetical protein